MDDRKRQREDSDDDDMMEADANPNPGEFMLPQEQMSAFAPAPSMPSIHPSEPQPMATVAGPDVGSSIPAAAAAAAAAATADIPSDLLSEDLRALLESMDDFTPTIPDAVTTFYLNRSGFNTSDTRMSVEIQT